MTMHWQQWYFVALYATGLLPIFSRAIDGKNFEAGLSATFWLIGVYALWSAGFFHGPQ